MQNVNPLIQTLATVNDQIDARTQEIVDTLDELDVGFTAVHDAGFSKSNLLTDLTQNVQGLALPEESELPNLGTVKGYTTVNSLPLKGYAKNGVSYVDPNEPNKIYNMASSNTLHSDRADGNLNINRWTTRNIFKFKDDYYGYDRCVFIIPIAELANGCVINGGDTSPHENTLKAYPYLEEFVMTSQTTDKNFIHFINVQYSDSHYGHFNKRNYNLMIVKDRVKYGVLDESEDNFKTMKSVYANDVNTELAYIKDGYLYMPVPDALYGEELLNTMWDCRAIWREDAPDRNVSISVSLEENGEYKWKEEIVGNETRSWWCVCYGGGKYVATAVNTNVYAYSTDGVNWNEGIISNTVRNWRSVCYGVDKFVAVTDGSMVYAYTSDALTWIEGNMPTTANWYSVCYGNGKFVTIAYSTQTFAYSSNGISWTAVTVGSTAQQWFRICYGDSGFVAVSRTGLAAYSADGISWTTVTINARQWYGLSYGAGKYVMITYQSDIFAYSTDGGATWTESTMPSNAGWYSLCYGDGKFITVSAYNDVFAYSTNGTSWTLGNLPDNRAWMYVCYGDRKYVAVGNNSNIFAHMDSVNFFTSQDFDISNDRVVLLYPNKQSIAHIRNRIDSFSHELSAIPAMTNPFILSTDGVMYAGANFDNTVFLLDIDRNEHIKWTEGTISSSTNRNWYSVCYGKDKYVVVSFSSNIFAYSTDGIAWAEVTVGTTNRNWSSVCYGNGKFVAVAYRSNIFAYSTDGISWTEGTIGSSNRYWVSVCYGKDKYVAVSFSSNIIAYSMDGITWTESANRSLYSVCYGNGKFVVVPYMSNIFAYSTGGVTWTEVTVGTTNREWSSVCYGNGKFVAVAYNSNVFAYSTDGVTWTEGTISSTNRYWFSICYGNGKYVAVARGTNRFAYSTDGITWTEGTISSTDRNWFSICYGNGKYVAVARGTNRFAYEDNFIHWKAVPNQFFKISNNTYLGFHYYNINQLYFGLFNAALKTLTPVSSYTDPNYPCINFSSEFDNAGKILKVFPKEIDYHSGISSYYVFTQTGAYEFTFSISNNTTSVNKLFDIASNDAPFIVMRIGKSKFVMYNSTGISIVTIGSTNNTINNNCVLLGKCYIAVLAGGNIDLWDYESLLSAGTSTVETLNPSGINNIIGKYGYFTDSNNKNVLCKLVETYTFDKELSPLPSYFVWREITVGNTILSWGSVCYGNSKFVAVASGNMFAYSIDGITWTEGNMPNSRQWISVCYGNGKYVTVAYRSNIFAYSIDGITWTEGTIGTTNRSWRSVCYGNDKYVAVANSTNIFAYSVDGITWTEDTISNTNENWYSVCYGNDKYVAVASSSNIFAYSIDGITWTEVTVSTNRNWRSICYGNGKYVAVAIGYIFAYSMDGITWTEVTVSTSRQWASVCYGNGKYVAVDSISNIFAYSTYGITWTEGTISNNNRIWRSICYGNGKFVVAVENSNIFAYGIEV